MAGRVAEACRCGACRGDGDGRESGGICRKAGVGDGSHRAGLWPLRRDAGRPARGVEHRALRAGNPRRPHLGPRCRRRQGAALHACQGLRGDVCHRNTPLQCEVHAGGRGGNRLRQASTPSAKSTANCSSRTLSWFPIPRCSRWTPRRLRAACAVWPIWRSR